MKSEKIPALIYAFTVTEASPEDKTTFMTLNAITSSRASASSPMTIARRPAAADSACMSADYRHQEIKKQ